MPSFSTTLEQAIHGALALANARRHELATLEHLLMALTDEPDAARVMRACGVDRRIIRLKLVLAWSVPLLTSVGIKLCELFCNRVVPRDVSGELALCCCLSCGLLYLVLMLWVNVKLNALAEACPAKGAE